MTGRIFVACLFVLTHATADSRLPHLEHISSQSLPTFVPMDYFRWFFFPNFVEKQMENETYL